MAQAFQDLTVWQRAMEPSESIYHLTKTFPKVELYGLTSQLRRAAISIASNIAEGRGRATVGEFKQFLCMAQGSTYEVHTQLMLAKRLSIGDKEMLHHAEALRIETSKKLGAFITSVSKKS